MRSLFGDGRRLADVAAALNRSKYAIQQVARWDPIKKGWWTPERPMDIAKFRKGESPQHSTADELDLATGPHVSHRKAWDKAEDERAHELLKSGMSTRKIAAELGRSVDSVRSRVFKRKEESSEVRPFSSEEDERIRALSSKRCSAEELQEFMPHRSLDAIKARARDLGVAKYLKAKPWTDEEVLKLCRLRAKSLSFREIALQLPGRTGSACKFKHQYMPEHLRPKIEETTIKPLDTAME
ncbi:Putative SANT/Myb domain, Homeobox-like domain superfamily protein [Septoria linicola]|uniref:SANT/Myb domain, Homeobox-like domain superfamily protein n=1 Tax=Septoria linicola TaxID=215465 RepID=A0A9Q9EM33_9PEZI|nr:putative SANT/Myb domain, Homeobox-like domain superfamily protein [Septoria linicola]USW55635.1 Putative SANT/Myb domain, Homeobox-like domain superfamily protein [Septoria linicola]